MDCQAAAQPWPLHLEFISTRDPCLLGLDGFLGLFIVKRGRDSLTASPKLTLELRKPGESTVEFMPNVKTLRMNHLKTESYIS